MIGAWVTRSPGPQTPPWLTKSDVISPGSLLVRSPPHPTENLRGWLLRLSDANGLGGYDNVLRAAGLDRIRRKVSLDEYVQAIAALAEVPVEQVEALFPKRDRAGKLRMSGVPGEIDHGWLSARNDPQVCPHCIAETGRIYAAWDLWAWVACPIHNCVMVDRCPTCAEPLSWKRRRMDACSDKRCRSRLTSARPGPPSPEVNELMLLLGAKAEIPGIPRASAIRQPFTQCGFADLAGAIGSFYVRGRMETAISTRKRLSDFDPMTVAQAAAEAMLDWPFAFHRFLDGVRDHGAAQEWSSLTKEFPGLLESVRPRQAAGESLGRSILLDEIKRYSDAQRGRDPGWIGVRSFRQPGEVKGWISAREAMRRLGMNWDTIRRLVDEGVLAARAGRIRSRTIRAIREDDVERLKAEWSRAASVVEFKAEGGLLSTEEAAVHLGISARAVSRLIVSGDLASVLRPPTTYVVRSSADALVSELAALASSEVPSKRGLIAPWLGKGSSYVPIEKALRAIREGRLPIQLVGNQDEGLRRLRCDLDALKDLAKEIMPPRQRPSTPPRRPAPKPGILDQHAEFLLGVISETPHITIAEMRARLAAIGVTASNGTVWNFLARNSLTFDKRPQRRLINGKQIIVTPRPKASRAAAATSSSNLRAADC